MRSTVNSHEERPATYADLEAVPPHLVAEIIDGVLFTRSHGHAAPAMLRTVLSYFLCGVRQSRTRPEAPWQIAMLPELHLGKDVLVPEFAAWSVERMPFLPDEHSSLPPDWVCELTSTDERRNPALSRKLEIYRQLGVRHVWIIDLTDRSMSVTDNAKQTEPVMSFGRDDLVRAPPFDAISFSLAALWPLDEPLGFDDNPQALYAGDR